MKSSTSESGNPLLEQAELQQKTQEAINRYVNDGLGKPVYEQGREMLIGVIIPQGIEKDNFHNLGLVYCNDGSLVQVYVDNFTNRFINPETADVVIIPNLQNHPTSSVAARVSSVINHMGEELEPKGSCRILCDIDTEPDKVVELLKDTVQRIRADLNERQVTRDAKQSQVNSILNDL